jgi:hypothetical protein
VQSRQDESGERDDGRQIKPLTAFDDRMWPKCVRFHAWCDLDLPLSRVSAQLNLTPSVRNPAQGARSRKALASAIAARPGHDGRQTTSVIVLAAIHVCA